MGTGSSKAGNQTLQSSQKPVANVNNEDAIGLSGYPQRNVGDKKQDDRGLSNILSDKNTNVEYKRDFGRASPIRPIEPNKKEKEKDKKQREKHNKAIGSATTGVSALVFENDSDFEDDIDAVLKIPVAADYSKQTKDKKGKKKEKSQNEENELNNDRWNPAESDEQLPETYAQRLQRKQYKFQQDLLFREKTIMRSSRDWDADVNDVNRPSNLELDSPSKGFDASRFRAANKGQDTKKELFSAVPDDLQTPRYLQTTGQDLDDIESARPQAAETKAHSPGLQRLPSYNQSELDLMQQLEADIL